MTVPFESSISRRAFGCETGAPIRIAEASVSSAVRVTRSASWSPVAIGAAASRMLALLVAVALAVVVVPLHRGPAAAAAGPG